MAKASSSTPKQPPAQPRSTSGKAKRVTLKDLAEYLDLSPATVSRALAGSPQADALASETRQRVERAARKLKYRPNYLARSLRGKRTYSVGVLVPEISEGYAAGIMSGVEDLLAEQGYFYLMVSHRSKSDVLDNSIGRLQDRGAEGLILVAGQLESTPLVPTVVISGEPHLDDVTHVLLDHDKAARDALEHLVRLGHEKIAFFRGSSRNIDAPSRWESIRKEARALGLEIRPELTLQLKGEAYGETFSAEGGYREGFAYGQELLARGHSFTALFAFNDISAIGAMRAFEDAGRRVPEEISVVGFDDIQSAAFHKPRLTTVRQPLKEMGETATRALVDRLADKEDSFQVRVILEPELVVRESTGRRPTG